MPRIPFHRLLLNGEEYWCHRKKGYVNPEDNACENFKPKIKGPLDKYIW
jgi:hypothetical protein